MKKWSPPMCSENRMNTIMKTASKTHLEITKKMKLHQDFMLQQCEIMSQIQLPIGIRGIEIYGYCTQKLNEFNDYLHVTEIFDAIKPGDAFIITGSGHTTALFRNQNSELFGFDSLAASVTKIEDHNHFHRYIGSVHNRMLEFTVTVLRHTNELIHE